MKVVAVLLIVFGFCEAYSYRPQDHVLLTTGNSPKCEAPNGAGLQPTLKEIQKFIPKDQIFVIVLSALANDREVQHVFTYATSQDGLARIRRIIRSDEVTSIIQFACQELHVDLYYYINTVAYLLGLPPVNPVDIRQPRIVEKTPRAGLRGVVQDILETIAVDDIKSLVQNRMASDEYLRMAIEKAKSAEVRALMNRLPSNEDIQKLLQDILQLGADIMAIIEDIRCVFGWNTPGENEGGTNSTMSY